MKLGAAVSVSPIARVPPGETVSGAPGLPPGGGVICRMNGTVVTVSVVDPMMFVFPCALVAEMVEVSPPVKPVARPLSVIVAATVFDETHTTEPVRSCVLLSDNVPVAVNCWVCPRTTVGLAGVTAMDISVGAVTVNCAVPLIAGVCVEVAVIVCGPTVFSVAEKFPTPFVSVEFAGSVAVPSVLVKCTVPV